MLVPTAEERARHLALATAEPNRGVAHILENAARLADARGASAAAAELAEQALRLTPRSDADDTRRRFLLAADRHYAAGDVGRAIDLLGQARDAAAPGVERATVLAQLARVEANPRDSVALYRAALSEAEADDALQAEIYMSLASLMRFVDGLQRGLEHAELAVRAAERVDDVELRCRALAMYGLLHFNTGRGIATSEMEAALALERTLADWPLPEGPAWIFGHQLWWSADVDRARPLFLEVLRAARARNDPDLDVRWFLSYLEWRAGNWDAAARYAAEYVELQSQYGRGYVQDELPAVIVDAHRGRISFSRAKAQGAIEWAKSQGNRNAQGGYGWVLGFIELSLGNVSAAVEHLRRVNELRKALFVGEPGVRLDLGDLLEALIGVGALDEAEDVLATWEPRAAALDRSWALAILARGRGLLLAVRGDLESAFASFDRALVEHARSGTDPFHHARTLLALGRTQRRAKQRGLARATLEDALGRFQRLSAPLWAEQTRAELARIGGRAPSRGELTEAERRIARLIAEGRTNREIAAALFLTEHSVETALTRVYQKLGVRSRVELARQLSNT
jgi:DNA-binding CsgD family transcriptional regulator